MALFDKSKSSGNEDISKIKLATSNETNTSSLPNSNMNSQEQFVNPFSQNSPNPQQSFNSQPNLNSMQQQSQQLPSFDNSFSQDSTVNSSNFQNPLQNEFNSQMSSMNTNLQNSEYISKEEVQDMINETIESVIESKWVEITDNVRKVVEWKGKVEDQINLMKEDLVAMQDAFAVLEKRLISKLNNYDKSILDVGSEIKALDKVFQKITPTLVNNVTELGKIAKDLKSVSINHNREYSKDNN